MDNGTRLDFKDMSKVVGETWRTLTSKERAPYEKEARIETIQYEEERRIFEKKHKIWADLQHKAKASGQLHHALLLCNTTAVLCQLFPAPAVPANIHPHENQ